MTEGEHAVARARDNTLTDIFGRANRVLIGVVHLLPLPASRTIRAAGSRGLCAGARRRASLR